MYLILTYYLVTTGYPMAFIFRQLISVTDSRLVQVIMTGLLIFIYQWFNLDVINYIVDINNNLVEILSAYSFIEAMIWLL